MVNRPIRYKVNSLYCACQHHREEHEEQRWTCQVCGDLKETGLGCSTFRSNCTIYETVKQINSRRISFGHPSL